MDRGRRRAMLAQVERTLELPLIILALLLVPLLLLPILFDLPSDWDPLISGLDWLIWGIFAADLLVRTALAERRLAYLRQHWLDLLVVAVPFLRPLRVLRAARVVALLRLLRVAVLLARVADGARRVLHVPQVLLGGGVLTVILALLVWLVERNADGNIKNLADALWWAFVTVATVGYGDKYPVTPEGRGLAVLLMLGGIGLFAALSASLARFLIRPSGWEQREALRALEERLGRLERLLEERLPAATEEQDQARRP